MKGLEPPRHWHWFLRPARLPVPPHPHIYLVPLYIITSSISLSRDLLYFTKYTIKPPIIAIIKPNIFKPLDASF